jgi:hypothetical protein
VVLRQVTSSRTSHIIAGVLMVLIFWIDLMTPSGISVPTCFIIPVIRIISASRVSEPPVLLPS